MPSRPVLGRATLPRPAHWQDLASSSGTILIELGDRGARNRPRRTLRCALVAWSAPKGANYQALEFRGPALNRSARFEDRLVLSNLAVEMGAKAAIFPGGRNDSMRTWRAARRNGARRSSAIRALRYSRQVIGRSCRLSDAAGRASPRARQRRAARRGDRYTDPDGVCWHLHRRPGRRRS